MKTQPAFSERHGYTQSQKNEIIFRDDLPIKLRHPVMDIIQRHNCADITLLDRIKKLFDPYGVKGLPALSGQEAVVHSLYNISVKESPESFFVREFMLASKWYQFLDFVEDIARQFIATDETVAGILGDWKDSNVRSISFQNEINQYFEYAGIGWKLERGQIVARFDEVLEAATATAKAELFSQGRKTAAERINQARLALSVRPKADLSGAISHATSAVECVLHDITGEGKTLGDYLKQYSGLFPASLKKALEGVWGYASEEGARHGKEGIEPGRDEAEFIISLCASVVTFLNRKNPRKDMVA